MKRFAAILTILTVIGLSAPARADKVGAVIGAGAGMVLAGPPGAIIGFFIGGIYGKPYWGADKSAYTCYLDNNFHRVCPKMPVGLH